MNLSLVSAWQWVAMSVGVIVTGIGAYFLARWSWRWLLTAIALVVALLFLVVLPRYFPAHTILDESSPPLLFNYFWTWMLLLLYGMTASGIFLVRSLRSARPVAGDESAEAAPAERFPDIEAAWKEIQLQLSHVQIDLASQNVILVLTPDEEWAEAMVEAGGLHLFAKAPATAAPIHAFATADGILLSLAGASSFGTQDAAGTRRLEAVCALVRAENPDCPIVRGVVVLFPISWAGLPESIRWATSLRDDLRSIERLFKVRCPVFTLFPQMESTPGFGEFIGRMTAALKQSRCGFAVPSSQTFSGDLVQRGLIWMSGWFNGWILNQMADDLLNQAGNNQLYLLDHEFRRYRKRLRTVMESAFTTHSGMEPVAFRGCYFLATGKESHEQAFVAGLLRGPRGRIFADHIVTEWTRQAQDDDRFYRKLALAVGLIGGGLTMLSWLGIIVATGNAWFWIGPVALTVVWIAAALRLRNW